jgi:anaerobic selenocysteine-containing dehydrogenase
MELCQRRFCALGHEWGRRLPSRLRLYPRPRSALDADRHALPAGLPAACSIDRLTRSAIKAAKSETFICMLALPGGNVEFARPSARDVKGAELLSAEQRAKCIELKRSPLGPGNNGWVGSDALYDAILYGDPYPIRGLFNFGRNFLINHADSERGARALSNLEFYVHCDVIMTPTSSLADIFLPVNTPWEREALRVGFEGSQAAANLVQFRQAVTESAGGIAIGRFYRF